MGAPADEQVPDVTFRGEVDGYFDKDEQGWCSTMIEVTQTGRRVRVRVWHDANGVLRSDHTREGTIGEETDEKIALRCDDGTVFWFDKKLRVVPLPR